MALGALIVVIITIFRNNSHLRQTKQTRRLFANTNTPPVPPVGVFLVAGCGADLLINILLTVLGYFPGHIHGASARPFSPSFFPTSTTEDR